MKDRNKEMMKTQKIETVVSGLFNSLEQIKKDPEWNGGIDGITLLDRAHTEIFHISVEGCLMTVKHVIEEPIEFLADKDSEFKLEGRMIEFGRELRKHYREMIGKRLVMKKVSDCVTRVDYISNIRVRLTTLAVWEVKDLKPEYEPTDRSDVFDKMREYLHHGSS